MDAFRRYHLHEGFNAFYEGEEQDAVFLDDLFLTFLEWAGQSPRKNYQLGITLKDEPDRIIGSCGVRTLHREAGCADMGIELAYGYWGRYRYAMEILSAMLHFAYEVLDLKEVRGRTIEANTRIGRLAKYFGAEYTEAESSRWVSERGWRTLEWQLTREQWRHSEHTRHHKG